MANCEACGKGEGIHHVTVTVTVFGPKATKVKTVQFWLCDRCELANQQVMAQDSQRRQRLAWRLTQEPQLFSRFRDWRETRFRARRDVVNAEG